MHYADGLHSHLCLLATLALLLVCFALCLLNTLQEVRRNATTPTAPGDGRRPLYHQSLPPSGCLTPFQVCTLSSLAIHGAMGGGIALEDSFFCLSPSSDGGAEGGNVLRETFLCRPPLAGPRGGRLLDTFLWGPPLTTTGTADAFCCIRHGKTDQHVCINNTVTSTSRHRWSLEGCACEMTYSSWHFLCLCCQLGQ